MEAPMRKGFSLRFYMQEKAKHKGILLYEWLLRQAKAQGIHGGSAFRAIAGYGRHGVLHEQKFFELEGELPVVVEFLVDEAEADKLLALVKEDGAHLFWARFPAEFGVFGEA
jgi:PII-like signaling protein